MGCEKLTKSFEDYLETIYLLKTTKGIVRVSDIANILKVSLPSVTEAIQKLANKSLVIYKKYNFIKLTKKGEQKAKEIYKKHQILFLFFTKVLNIDKKTASRDACLIEHCLSNVTLHRLERFVT